MELTYVLKTTTPKVDAAPSDGTGSFLSRMRWGLALTTASFVTFLLVGNGLILGSHLVAMNASGDAAVSTPAGIRNFHAVDQTLWRGGRPNDTGYRELAARGVTTIVDLRAEEGLVVPEQMIADLGMDLVRIPLRDGQAPTDEQVATFLDAVRTSPGTVYVHCMAGVGRTGTMVAAYLVELRGVGTTEALTRNLAVGPPSLEQIAFVTGHIEPANPVVTAISRVLDGPRRLYHYVK